MAGFWPDAFIPMRRRWLTRYINCFVTPAWTGSKKKRRQRPLSLWRYERRLFIFAAGNCDLRTRPAPPATNPALPASGHGATGIGFSRLGMLEGFRFYRN